MNSHSATSALLSRFKELRKSAGISESDLEKILILGPGWVSKIETGEVIPRLNTLLALLNSVGADLPALIREIDISRDTEIDRQIASEDRDDGLLVRFPYGKFDAEYLLHGATQNQFSHILKRLRNGLAKLAITGEVDLPVAEKNRPIHAFTAQNTGFSDRGSVQLMFTASEDKPRAVFLNLVQSRTESFAKRK